MTTRAEFATLLSAHGVLPTPQRIDVAQVMLTHPQHLSADQVIARTREMGSGVSKATVYNTLSLFCERGLLRTVEVDPTRQFYDSSTNSHHHFFNVDTGELTDIPAGAVMLDVTAPLPAGTERAGVAVVVRVRNSKRH